MIGLESRSMGRWVCLLICTFTYLLLLPPSHSFAETLRSVEKDKTLPWLADGVVLWGEGILTRPDEQQSWEFPFDSERLEGAEIEAELFWNNLRADLSLIAEFRGKAPILIDGVNTQSEVLYLPKGEDPNQNHLFRAFSISRVEYIGTPNRGAGVGYHLRCVVRRRRPVPEGGFDFAGTQKLTLGVPSPSTEVTSADRNEHWWPIQIPSNFEIPKNLKPFDTTLFVTLDDLSPDDFKRYELRIYEKTGGHPRLRKTALRDPHHPPECFLSLEHPTAPENYLIRVSSEAGDIGTYQLKGELLFPGRADRQHTSDEAPSAFLLGGKRPWKQRIIAPKRWATKTFEIPVWNPGQLIVSADSIQINGNFLDRTDTKSSASIEPAELLELWLEGNTPRRWEPEELENKNRFLWRIPIESESVVKFALQVSEPEASRKPQLSSGSKLDIHYKLGTKVLPDWHVISKGELINKFRGKLFSFFKPGEVEKQQGQVHKWLIKADQDTEYEINVFSSAENGWFDIEVFDEKTVKFLTRASGNPQSQQGAYQRSSFFKGKNGEQYTVLVSLNTRPKDPVSYQIAFEPRERVTENTLAEGKVRTFDKTTNYQLQAKGPAQLLIHIAHPNLEAELNVEVSKSNIKQEFERIHYGTHEELAISLPESDVQTLTIRPIDDPKIGSTISYTRQRKGLDIVEKKPIDSSKSNDHIAFAEWVYLPQESGEVRLVGQVNSKSDPADCWRVESAETIPVELIGSADALRLEVYRADGEIEGRIRAGAPKLNLKSQNPSEPSVFYLMVIDSRIPKGGGGDASAEEYTLSIHSGKSPLQMVQMESDVDFRR